MNNLEKMIAKPGTYQVTITPTEAELLLARNPQNRTPKWTKINQYASAMGRGDWLLTNQGIGIDTEGNLIDGQNRLMACMRANTPFTTLLTTGLPTESRNVIDTGVRRSLADALTMEGRTNVKQIAMICNVRIKYEEGIKHARTWLSAGSGLVISHRDGIDYLNHHPSIEVTMPSARSVWESALRMIPLSALGTLTSMFYELDEVEAAKFTEAMKTGAGLQTGDPYLTLRNFYIRSVPRERTFKHILAGCKAWNAKMEGRALHQIIVKSGEECLAPVPLPLMLSQATTLPVEFATPVGMN